MYGPQCSETPTPCDDREGAGAINETEPSKKGVKEENNIVSSELPQLDEEKQDQPRFQPGDVVLTSDPFSFVISASHR